MGNVSLLWVKTYNKTITINSNTIGQLKKEYKAIYGNLANHALQAIQKAAHNKNTQVTEV